MKQIEFETHIKASNVDEVLIDSYGLSDAWMLTIFFKTLLPSAIHTARGEVKTFAQIDSALRFVRDCGWTDSVRIAPVNVN